MSELSYWKLLTRRKTISDSNQHTPPKTDKLKRLELPNIGISTTFGIGIFVIIGFVARNIAGPSVIVCITVAALISFLSGTFYAELSSRITKNASTYTYVYVCIGELQAFIVGWTIILEYVIGVAIVSESIGLHVDTLLNNTIKNSFKEFAPMHWSALGTYFDFIGFSIPIFFAIIVNIGLKRSEFLNKLFAVISVAIMLFIVIAGAFRAERSNWYTIPDPLLTNLNAGVGGFAPFEYFGILRGVAVCIFIFIGLEITGTGTRWKSLYGTLSFVFGTVSMIGVGTVVTLALPFYLLNEHAQLPQIFNIPSWYTAYWIIAIGGIIVLFASMYGLMFSMQITVLAMAKDSLLPKSFDSDKHTKPIIEILCAGLIAGLLAGLFEMAHLIDMLSIGIIFGFMATAFAVVMFRYSNEYEYGSVSTIDVADSNNLPDKDEKPTTILQIARQLFQPKNQKKPTGASYAVVKILLVGLGLVSLGLAWMANFAYLNIYNLDVWAITVTVVLLLLLIIIIFLISLQPMRKLNAIFMVPFVPLSPAISIVVNIYLMMSLHYYAWIRFGIWIIFGLVVYFFCIVKYNRRSQIDAIKAGTLSKNGFKNHGFVGDIDRHPSFSFNSQSQMTYKSDDITETENDNVDRSKLNTYELENEIPISPKSTKKSKAPIPMSFKTENQMQTEASTSSLAPKSGTPSPNSNKTLDDIVLISEVIDTLTEMKEPNGKTYFVDEIRTATTVGDTQDDNEQKTAIEYLDDVLKKEDINDDNAGVNASEHGISTSVVAVVHLNVAVEEKPSIRENEKDPPGETLREDETTSEKTAEEETISTDENIDSRKEETIPSKEENSEVSQENVVPSLLPSESDVPKIPETLPIVDAKVVVRPEEVSKETSAVHVNQLHLEQSNLSDSKSEPEKPMTFKERLALLLGQQPIAEVRRISPKANHHLPSNTTETKLKHSKSEPDIFNSMVMQGVLKDIRSDGSKKQLPMTTTDDIHIDDTNTSVPAPPKFDPFIYKTIGSRQNARTTLKIGDDSESDTLQRPPMTAPVIMDNNDEDVMFREKTIEEDDHTRMVSIKDRLENILKRGPPDRFSRPKSIVPTTVDESVTTTSPATVANSQVDEEEVEVVRIKESKKPFDTVHKQKVLFNDVLKSIGAETRPSVIRANSVTKSRQKPATIEDAKKALKRVDPDWKKNF